MAKLKAPLLSLGASQQIGKSIVFFPWKGLNCAREYVVPSNPNTTAQQAQRGYLRDIVALIHTCQGLPVNPLDADDVIAYSLLGSLFSTPRTWFNTIIKMNLDAKVAGLLYGVFCNGTITEAADEIDLSAYGVHSVDATAGNVWYGTSKSALIHSKAATVVANHWTVDITSLTTGVKYYVQFKPTAPASAVGLNSGIYHGVPL